MLVEVSHRHPLKFSEHDFAHVDDDALSDIRHQIRLPVVKNSSEREHDDDTNRNEVEHCHIAFGKNFVDHVLDNPRQVKIRARRADYADYRQAEASEVRFDVD